VAAIDKLVTGNDIRARLVLNEWRRLAGDPARGRALVFCVSVAHARFMAAQLDRAGIKAACVVGDTPPTSDGGRRSGWPAARWPRW
jgi:superfamily II DNA or RNA helicase